MVFRCPIYFFFLPILTKFGFSQQICLEASGSGGFTVKLVKLKLQSPSKGLGGALPVCSHGHMFL